MLMNQIRGADLGTKKMQEIADAVREGANAYLKRQLTTVAILIVVLVVVLFVTKAIAPARASAIPLPGAAAGAFLIGAIFSGTVGFVGMRLATQGNLRVAAAAPGRLRQGADARLPHRHDHGHVDRRPGPAGRHA